MIDIVLFFWVLFRDLGDYSLPNNSPYDYIDFVMMEKSKRLNSEQQKAVEHGRGPLLIVAGAGTGKTTVVTERIKFLIGSKLAKPEEILALTFTEKAAREMEERVDVALPYGTFGMWISTFHSFCDRVLRAEALHIGLTSNFKLMTEAESYLFVKKNFWQFSLSYFRPGGNPYKFIEGMIQHFSRLKDEDVEPEEYLGWAKEIKGKKTEKENEDEGEAQKYLELANAYKTYEDLKANGGVMDFSDLISKTLRLFRTRKNVLARYRQQFKYLLVDEFQDTNFAQNELLKLLAGEKANITVVADDDQSIYRFRGAAVSNVIQFRKTYPHAKLVTLVRNYRSTQEILDRSYDLIRQNNPDRLEVQEKIAKKLFSSGEKGGKITFNFFERAEDEADYVVKAIKAIKSIKENKYNWKDFAILVRANNHSEPFIRAFERARVPFQFLGPGMLFRQPEIRDLIAYLRVLADFTDSVSLYRVLSMNIWQLPQRDLISVLNYSKKVNLSFFEGLELLTGQLKLPETSPTPAKNDSWDLPANGSRNDGNRAGGFQQIIIEPQTKETLTRFVDMVHRHQNLISKETAGQLLYYFLADSGLLKNIAEYKTALEEHQAQNITKFFDKLKSFEAANEDAGVFAAVDYLNLAMEMGESPLAAEIDWTANDAVNILTIHSAKGLEFPVVFLVNLVEGRFPSRERREQIPIPDKLIKEVLPRGDFHLEEERRLFYVGMTRAKKELYFAAAGYYGEGKRERKISPFVLEAIGMEAANQKLVPAHEKQLPLFEWNKPPEPLATGRLPLARVDYLSYSAIDAFQTCPLHYKLRHILRLPSQTTAPLSLGNSVHLALRDFYRQFNERVEESKRTLHGQARDLLMELLDKNWEHAGYLSQKHEEESLLKARGFLEQYLETELHKAARPIMLEQPFTYRLDPTLKIGGKIDRVDDLGGGMIEIIDYKTGSKIPEQKDIDKNLQMTLYALAAVDPGVLGRKIENVKLSFYFFDNATKISTVRTAEQLTEAKKEVLAIRDQIEHSDFTCSGGVICQNCEYKILCN